MTQKILLIYHNEDNDGLFSSALIYNYLVKSLNIDTNDIQLFGADYNILSQYAEKNSPQELHEEYTDIIMTDISFNDPKYMLALYNEFKSNFIWIDHHAPIIKASYQYGFDKCEGIRDTSKSAILGAYQWFYDQFNEKYLDRTMPDILRILSGWDSWSWEQEGFTFEMVRNVNKAITYEFNLDFNKIYPFVTKILNNKISHIQISGFYKNGAMLNDYDDRNMASIIQTSGDKSWKLIDGDRILNACALFHQGPTNSIMFKSLQKTDPNITNGIIFKHAKNGNWTVSLYNIYDESEFHCGDFVKKKYNGGGHKGASGCTLSEEQFIKILKEKTF